MGAARERQEREPTMCPTCEATEVARREAWRAKNAGIKTPCTLAVADLTLGDIVRVFDGDGYSDATVIKLEPHAVTFFRPYVHTADFSCSGGPDGTAVIAYVGSETWRMCRDDSRPVTLLRRLAIPLK